MESILARTSVDLFRMGNSMSARLDHVRRQDVDHYPVNGQLWVRAGSGGISTFDRMGSSPGRWWRLAAGHDYGLLLLVWNDHGRHWSWEPAQDMSLKDYKALLIKSNADFV